MGKSEQWMLASVVTAALDALWLFQNFCYRVGVRNRFREMEELWGWFPEVSLVLSLEDPKTCEVLKGWIKERQRAGYLRSKLQGNYCKMRLWLWERVLCALQRQLLFLFEDLHTKRVKLPEHFIFLWKLCVSKGRSNVKTLWGGEKIQQCEKKIACTTILEVCIIN